MIQEIVVNQLLAEFLADETKQTALEVHLVLTYSKKTKYLTTQITETGHGEFKDVIQRNRRTSSKRQR